MFNRFAFCLTMLCVSLAFSPLHAEDKKEEPVDTAKMKEIISKTQSLFAKVNFYLKYDKGDAPKIGGYLCGNCSRFHGVNAGDYVKDERPVQACGYILSPTEVLCADLQIPPRFLDRIEIIVGDQVSEGVPNGYYLDQHAISLKLSKALDNAKTLAFVKPNKKDPLLKVNYSINDGLWRTIVAPAPRKLSLIDKIGREILSAPPNCLLVTKNASAAGISVDGKFSVDAPISPLEWKKLSTSDYKAKIDELTGIAKASIINLKLNFRSPRVKPGHGGRRSYSRSRKTVSTELYTSGIIFDKKKVLVFASLQAKETARLESINASIGNKEFELKFVCSLKDYTAIIAESDSVLTEKTLDLADSPVQEAWDKFLFKSNINLKGNILSYHFGHTWISSFKSGWKQQQYPYIPGDSNGAYLFDENLKLLFFPLSRRSNAKMGRSYGSGSKKKLLSVEYVKEILENPLKHADKSNIPVMEKEEGRIAWLGVETQSLGSELARSKNLSELTEDGRKGVLITYVYPESPAAKANLKPGDVLLRVKPEGQNDPIPLVLKRSSHRPFPWAKYEQIPERYYERLPTPWQSVENELNEFLTNLGFDKKIDLDCFIDGKVVQKDFTIQKSPTHFEMAGKYKDERLGMTVRNLTYEVQRYFQKTKVSPGVIIAKIEAGSKASISGLKPYEIIVSVNGEPVKNVKDFEKLVKGKQELRFGVERMSVARTVKVDMPTTPAPEKEEKKE